jgi:hypothetical protein
MMLRYTQVVSHIPASGAVMQSAAKVPILVAFNTEERQGHGLPVLHHKLACIFKVGDDIRQDVLAIQVCACVCFWLGRHTGPQVAMNGLPHRRVSWHHSDLSDCSQPQARLSLHSPQANASYATCTWLYAR